VALIGECASSRTLEAAPLAQNAGVPLVTPASTNPRVTRLAIAFSEMCFADPFQGEVPPTMRGKNSASEEPPCSPIRVLPIPWDSPGFFANIHGARWNHRRSQKYSGGDKDLRAQLTVIRAGQSDAIFLPGYYVEAGLAGSRTAELGVHATLLGGDGFEAPQLIEIGGAALNGLSTPPIIQRERGPGVHKASSKRTGHATAVFPSDFPT